MQAVLNHFNEYFVLLKILSFILVWDTQKTKSNVIIPKLAFDIFPQLQLQLDNNDNKDDNDKLLCLWKWARTKIISPEALCETPFWEWILFGKVDEAETWGVDDDDVDDNDDNVMMVMMMIMFIEIESSTAK